MVPESRKIFGGTGILIEHYLWWWTQLVRVSSGIGYGIKVEVVEGNNSV